MTSSLQRPTGETHHDGPAEHGLDSFEVHGLDTDKTLIRGVARRLAMNDEAAGALRLDLARRVGFDELPVTGRILAALRRSPLLDAELDLAREVTAGRAAGA